ncbi:MAG: SusD/RagB family nutrient-binding outer membrane lipoprotein [Bacteroidales bacterium]|nr:SusD/RagB family nutrient-binding outer membrane lipoprotein [Bacteroidales bacterium]
MMKIYKYIILSCVFAFAMASCNDWLDVNTDPDAPNNESALVASRLPWIQKFWLYTSGPTNYRASLAAGHYYSSGANNFQLCATWDLQAGTTTTSYQTWFVGVAGHLNDLYNKAEKEGAYHYMAMANIFHAMGFMHMLDLYSEMPYTEALSSSPVPSYDEGKVIFYGCMDKLDEAIALLGKTQEQGATYLSAGDMWNGGNVSQWIKLCNGLKARFAIKLSKKADLFDPAAILDYISKGPQSNAENILAPCFNSASDATDYLWGDPIMTNGNWDYVAYGSTQRVSQFLMDMLTNMRGSGVTDPRMSKIVPATMSNIKLGSDGRVQSYEWLRSKAVDFYGPSTRLLAGGANSIQQATFAHQTERINYTIANAAAREAFIADQQGNRPYEVNGDVVTVTYLPGSLYVNSPNYLYAGDTVYVNLRQNSTLTGNGSLGPMDMNWYYTTQAMNAGAVGSTGSFQTRPNSDQDILTYYEMCFIKAEVYLRQGNSAMALAAYKDGIQAHMNRMQTKLTEWRAAGYTNPDMWPMDAAEITAYLNSAAVCQNAGELTMADIMLQKYIAMGCSVETWNDMRRFNYSAGNVGSFGVVYPGYDRGPLFAGQAKLTGTSKTDPRYWQRRWRLPDNLELNYNRINAIEVNTRALDIDIWSYPVWWDCATDQEYQGYIGK